MKPRILIVDDDEDVCTLYGNYLRGHAGWEVVHANSGEEALSILNASFWAVVLDQNLPGIQGLQVLHQIRSRANWRHICIAMLTATDDPELLVKTYRYQPGAFLRKQITKREDLYATLKELILRPPRVFLSYSHRDQPKVQDLFQRLKNEFVEPWFDKDVLVPGQDWAREIRNAVKSSDIVAVCLTDRAVGSMGYVQAEIRQALEEADKQPEGSIFVIPLRLEPCEIPASLTKWQRVDLFEDDGFERFLKAIQLKAKEIGLAAGQR